MAFFEIKNVRIVGLSTCVPKTIRENRQLDILSENESNKLISSIGIERRRMASEGICSSDLCFEAANKLIEELNWNKGDIDCLIFVSQTPDYILPATSCILQNRLGLKEECFALDISSGCSAWSDGLSVIVPLLSSGQMKKGLLLIGDILTSMCSSSDKISYLLGDSGTVTALEFEEGAEGFKFHTGTDGSGYDAIIIHDGGFRNPFSSDSLTMREIKPGLKRNKLNLLMNGMDVFSFGIDKAPKSVKGLLEHHFLTKEDIDFYIFHQANLNLNETIRRKLKLPQEKVPYSLNNFGNTGCASIPLTMTTMLGDELRNEKLRFLTCGFGTGLSWGSVIFETSSVVCPDLIEI